MFKRWLGGRVFDKFRPSYRNRGKTYAIKDGKRSRANVFRGRKRVSR